MTSSLAPESDCVKAEKESRISTQCTKGGTRAVASSELHSKSGTSSSIYCSDLCPDEICSRPPGFTFGNGAKAKRGADSADGEQRIDDELKAHLRNEQAGTKHEQRGIAVRLVCHASDEEEHRHPIDAKQELLAGRLSLSDVLYLMIHWPLKDIKALPPLRTLALDVRSACSVFGQWTTLTSFAQQL